MTKEFDLINSPLFGTHLIEASAGTGKTFTIAFLVLRLLVEREMKIGEILVLTYTNNATDELRRRIRTFLKKAIESITSENEVEKPFEALRDKYKGDEKASRFFSDALRDFDEAAIHTIHSFCRKVLDDHSFESNRRRPEEIVSDQSPWIGELLADFWRRHLYPLPMEAFAILFNKKKTFLSDIQKLAIKIPKDPITQLEDEIEVKTPPTAFSLRKRFEELKDLWQKEREEIAGEIEKAKEVDVKSFGNLLPSLESFFSSNFAFPLWEEIMKFDPEKKLKKDATILTHRFFLLLLDFKEEAKRFQREVEEYYPSLLYNLYLTLKNELPRRKLKEGIYAFEDLLVELYRSSQRVKDAVRKKYRAALVDEFQDTDPIQYEIIRNFFDGEDSFLVFIGDPRQAIYSFRGADLFTYLTAREGLSQIHTLSQNHRSTSGLVEAINTIFSRHDETFVFPEVKFLRSSSSGNTPPISWPGESKAPLEFWYLEEADTDLITSALASEIQRLLSAGSQGKILIGEKPLSPDDIAILVADRYEARDVRAKLKQQGINCVFQRMGYLFETREAKEILRIIRAVLEPHRSELVRAALATSILGFTGPDLLGREEETYYQDFIRYRTLWEKDGFLTMFRELLREKEVRKRLLSLPEGERRLTNVLHLGEVIARAEEKERLTPNGLPKWIIRNMERDSSSQNEYELRLERDTGAVRISTIHGAKGLEFPIVFCPFLWKTKKKGKEPDLIRYHKREDASWKPIFSLRGHGEGKERARKEAQAEDCRRIYVALTRACFRLYVVFVGKGKEERALNFILGLPDDVTEENFRGFIQELSQKSGGNIAFRYITHEPDESLLPAAAPHYPFSLQVREPPDISRRIETMASFTYFISQRSLEHVEDIEADLTPNTPPPVGEVDAIFTLPSGVEMGIFIHRIMEQISATHLDEAEVLAIIDRNLRFFGHPAGWRLPLWEMVKRVFNTPLDGGGKITLSSIAPTERLAEMAFTLPMGETTGELLSSLFNESPIGNRLNKLQLQITHGFLRGFIDLVFRHEDKYYLVDWKTNHLGYTYADYAAERLEGVMQEHLYHLQFHLYLLALHRHLKRTLRGYNYERHVGGVFYLFVRGINPTQEGRTGIYSALPSREIIEKMEVCLLEGNGK